MRVPSAPLALLVLAVGGAGACGDDPPADFRGDWYTLATNPNPAYVGKIVTDAWVTFRTDSTVVAVRRTEQGTESDAGTYRPGPAANQVTATFDLGPAGVQHTVWQLEAPGDARTVQWRNQTTGREHPADDRFILKGSAEWARREQVTFLSSRPAADTLPDPGRYPAHSPERVFLTYLRAWNRHDWAAMARLSVPSFRAKYADPADEIRASLQAFTPLGASDLAVERLNADMVRMRATTTLRFGAGPSRAGSASASTARPGSGASTRTSCRWSADRRSPAEEQGPDDVPSAGRRGRLGSQVDVPSRPDVEAEVARRARRIVQLDLAVAHPEIQARRDGLIRARCRGPDHSRATTR